MLERPIVLIVIFFCTTVSALQRLEHAPRLTEKMGLVFLLAQQEWQYRLSVHAGYDHFAQLLLQEKSGIVLHMSPRIVHTQEVEDWTFDIKPQFEHDHDAECMRYDEECDYFMRDLQAVILLLEALLSEVFRSYYSKGDLYNDHPASLTCQLSC